MSREDSEPALGAMSREDSGPNVEETNNLRISVAEVLMGLSPELSFLIG